MMLKISRRIRMSDKAGISAPFQGCRSAFSLPSRGKANIISGSAGGVPERLKGADCKSVGLAPTLVRIQPPPPVSGAPAGREHAGEISEIEECREGGGLNRAGVAQG